MRYHFPELSACCCSLHASTANFPRELLMSTVGEPSRQLHMTQQRGVSNSSEVNTEREREGHTHLLTRTHLLTLLLIHLIIHSLTPSNSHTHSHIEIYTLKWSAPLTEVSFSSDMLAPCLTASLPHSLSRRRRLRLLLQQSSPTSRAVQCRAAPR
jgi:hypothetical protein